MISATKIRTRKVSPTIHAGAEPPVVSSKKAPRHCSLVNWVTWKSASLMGQFFPPKDIVRFNAVLQAKNITKSLMTKTNNDRDAQDKTHDMYSTPQSCLFQVRSRESEHKSLRWLGKDLRLG